MAELTISSDEIRSAIANYTSSYSPEASREEVGVVISAADGIAQVAGMPSVMTNELLEFPGGVIGVGPVPPLAARRQCRDATVTARARSRLRDTQAP